MTEIPPNRPRAMQLGRLPTKSDPRAVMFARFADLPKVLPKATNFWKKRAPIPRRSFGNLSYGDCTRAKQANAAMRTERLEVHRTPTITDDEVVRVYVEMSNRLYGGGDNGAFETDALDCWRRPEYTFRDKQGRPLTIDAYVRVDPFNHEQLKSAIYTAASKGIAICLNLPLAFQSSAGVKGVDWDLPEGQQPIGNWSAGSWGGHSMWCFDYDEVGLSLDHTWELAPQRLTWRAAAAYLDEAHLVIDSVDAWRKKAAARKLIDLDGIKKAVNAVSSHKIAA